jgi:pyruvate ferredoxin oxidoreductase alpha subunit
MQWKTQRTVSAYGKELSKITGNSYPLFETYMLDDAEAVIVVMNSTAGNTKSVIDKMRKDGKKVGLLKPRLFRPFPYGEIAQALTGKKSVAILDRASGYGSNAPLYSEIKSAMFEVADKPRLKSYVFDLAEETSSNQIWKMFSTPCFQETLIILK